MVTNAFDRSFRPGKKLPQFEFLQLVQRGARVRSRFLSPRWLTLRGIGFLRGQLLQRFEVFGLALQVREKD